MSKVASLAPTFDIKDPHVRAFADSLSNAWQLRNGNIGADDSQRFITKQEWDLLAKNPAIAAVASIGQPGSSVPGVGGSTSTPPPPTLPPGVQNAIDFLVSGITLIDFTTITKNNNELFASVYALTTLITNSVGDITKLKNDITQINTIDPSSTSPSAQTLYALKEQVNDPVTGLPAAAAAIIEINNVSVNSTSANAQKTAQLIAQVFDPLTGNLAAMAAISEINNVSATSTSANARQTAGLVAEVHDPITGLTQANAAIVALNDVSATSSSANARTTAGLYASVNDPNSGMGAAFAAINAINFVDANSTSASARQLYGTTAGVGLKSKVFAQSTPPVSDASYTLKVNDLWINTANHNNMMRWNGSGWVDAADLRIADASVGIITETNTRVQQDNVLAQSVNTVWGIIGNNNGLVQQGSSVSINPGAGSANNFIQVQNALKDPNGNIVQAATKQSFDTYVNMNEARAHAAYTLEVQAQSGGILAVAGMRLYADAGPAGGGSGVVFLADAFAVYNGNTSVPPFSIYQHKIRMAATYLSQYMQSDSWISRKAGWIIRQDGSAEFNGAVFLGQMLSGSTFVDADSGQIMGTTAVVSWNSVLQDIGPSISTNSSLTLYGPGKHTQTNNIYQRIRRTDLNGIQLVAVITFIGVADDHITIWARKNGGNWVALTYTSTPSDSYGAVTCGWSGTFDVALNDIWQFGVSPTNQQMQVLDPTKTALKDFTMSVTVVNI